jgi:hypothetical protein
MNKTAWNRWRFRNRGSQLSRLVDRRKDWQVYGMARRPGQREGILPIAVDLQDAIAVQATLPGCGKTRWKSRRDG